MAFLEDPRLRQRWNQISQTTETVTENAAAGIWTFGHTYINPCLASITASVDSCTSVCLGDREERARRARERERARGTAEYSFDFYDDWDEDLLNESAGGSGSGGLFSGWRHEDWDRLVAGTGKRSKGNGGVAGEISEQPRSRKRGMSYGTRGGRRKGSSAEDPTIIPSTQPIGFLGRLPFKIGGQLRYKPSAANLQDHVGGGTSRVNQVNEQENEAQPLLDTSDDEEYFHQFNTTPRSTRKRSGTTGSGDTSDSYRSRGDLFPSDGEGEEDAVPLDDEFAVALDRVDDRSSNRTRSTKGKRPSDATMYRKRMSRTVSRTTMSSDKSRPSLRAVSSASGPVTPIKDEEDMPSLRDLQVEEERLQREEEEEVERKRRAAEKLAVERGLRSEEATGDLLTEPEVIREVKEMQEAVPDPALAQHDGVYDADPESAVEDEHEHEPESIPQPARFEDVSQEEDFVPARLPYFR